MRLLREMRQSLQDGCDVTKTPNHTECIRCGMCIRACSTKAVCFRYGFGDGKDKAKAAETLQTNNNNREE